VDAPALFGLDQLLAVALTSTNHLQQKCVLTPFFRGYTMTGRLGGSPSELNTGRAASRQTPACEQTQKERIRPDFGYGASGKQSDARFGRKYAKIGSCSTAL